MPAAPTPKRVSALTAALLSGAAILLSAAAILATAAPAGARPFVIEARGSETGPGVVRAIGDFRPPRNPRLGAAIRAYGDPSSTSGGGEICRVRWADIGVRITFQNFGGVDSCEPSGGRAQKAVVQGDTRWRTVKGLRIGNTVARLERSTRARAAPRAATGSRRASCRSAARCPTPCWARAWPAGACAPSRCSSAPRATEPARQSPITPPRPAAAAGRTRSAGCRRTG